MFLGRVVYVLGPLQSIRELGAALYTDAFAMKPLDLSKIPTYDQLPVKSGTPKGAFWGVFGENDQLGCLNFLTPENLFQTNSKNGRALFIHGTGFSYQTKIRTVDKLVKRGRSTPRAS
jgi:hypothetical protein